MMLTFVCPRRPLPAAALRLGLQAVFSLLACVLFCACGGSRGSSEATQATCQHPGAATPGAADVHCVGQTPQSVSAAACTMAAVTADANATASDANATMGSTTSEYGATLYGLEGDDDDCKYHVVWHASAICEQSTVTFYATLTRLTDGAVVTGATPRLEVFLNDTHPAPNSDQQPTQSSPGTYAVGPVRFDAPGQWTVRWHFFENCDDSSPASPHGHAAFFVSVP